MSFKILIFSWISQFARVATRAPIAAAVAPRLFQTCASLLAYKAGMYQIDHVIYHKFILFEYIPLQFLKLRS